MTNGTSDKHLSGCTKSTRLGNHVNPHNVMRDILADFASHAHMQPEQEPSLVSFKGIQGKAAFKADLRVVVEGQLRYDDATVVSMYRKDVRMNKTAPALTGHHVTLEVQSDQCPEAHESHAASYGCGGRHDRHEPRLTDRTGHSLAIHRGALRWPEPMGHVSLVADRKALARLGNCLERLWPPRPLPPVGAPEPPLP